MSKARDLLLFIVEEEKKKKRIVSDKTKKRLKTAAKVAGAASLLAGAALYARNRRRLAPKGSKTGRLALAALKGTGRGLKVVGKGVAAPFKVANRARKRLRVWRDHRTRRKAYKALAKLGRYL